jgi:hypothetical protein
VKASAGLTGLAIAGLLWLGLFSLVFSIGAALDLWPAAAESRSGRIEVAVGVAFGVLLLGSLIRRPK